MHDFAYRIANKLFVEEVLPPNPEYWFHTVVFAHLEASTAEY